MNSELLDQISHQMGANGLPYAIPIHPNLVHLTLGLFIIAIIFDLVGVFFPLEKWLFNFLGIKVERSQLFDVGWYNIFAASVIGSPTSRYKKSLGNAGNAHNDVAWCRRCIATSNDCGYDLLARLATLRYRQI